jgi:hypothetical protein
MFSATICARRASKYWVANVRPSDFLRLGFPGI